MDLPPGILAGVGGVAAVVVLRLVLGNRLVCPECGKPAPFFRIPASGRQANFGGWTCSECGCESDRRGRKVKRRPKGPKSS